MYMFNLGLLKLTQFRAVFNNEYYFETPPVIFQN